MKSRYNQFLLAGITVAALAPFLNKAYDIDDPLFLWIGQQIVRHPLDPYGTMVHWARAAQPMWTVMQNPPLCSYYIALFGSLFGFGEVVMHFAFLFPAVAAILGTYALARRFCGSPVTAALLTLFAPVFLVSATHVMCDVMLAGFWVWAIEAWLEGLEREKRQLLLTSSLLISAAMLTKYFGLSLVPLLFVYTVMRRRRLVTDLLYLMLPIVVMAGFEIITKQRYGQPLFSSAMFYLREVTGTVRAPLTGSFLVGCSFVGGCMIGGICLLSTRNAPAFLITLCLLLLVGFGFWVKVVMPADMGDNVFSVRLQGCLFATIGVAILLVSISDFYIQRDADSLLLLLWTLGTFVFATFLNWSITARTILPMAPAVAILCARRWDRSGGARLGIAWKAGWVSVAITISMIVTAVDSYEANSSRLGARLLQKHYGLGHSRVWFESHWGFQYYMQHWKAKPMTDKAAMHTGDLLVIPSNNADVYAIARPIVPLGGINCSIVPFLSTFAPGTGAGFYSSVRGPVPWAFARTKPARFDVFQVR